MTSWLQLPPRRLILGQLAFVTILLSGCVAPAPPESIELPKLVWEHGIEPSSPLENDPIVQFARTATAAEAYAWNNGHFAFAQLTESFYSDYIESLYRYYKGQSRPQKASIYPGPTPWQPLEIERTDSGSYRLYVCGSDSIWTIKADDPAATGILDRSLAAIGSILIDDNGDGTYRVRTRNYGGTTGEYLDVADTCNGDEIPVGRYRATPTFPRIPVIDAPHPPRTLGENER